VILLQKQDKKSKRVKCSKPTISFLLQEQAMNKKTQHTHTHTYKVLYLTHYSLSAHINSTRQVAINTLSYSLYVTSSSQFIHNTHFCDNFQSQLNGRFALHCTFAHFFYTYIKVYNQNLLMTIKSKIHIFHALVLSLAQ